MVTDEKQESLLDRLRRARRKRRLPVKEGHEVSAEGKEMRTPSRGEFFGNLEKMSDTKQLPHPRAGRNGGDAD